MARMPRLIVPGYPHLVLQHGRPGQLPFRVDDDRRDYLAAMEEAVGRVSVAIHAFALLDDAVWLLLTPQRAGDLATFMHSVSRRYVSAHHRRHASSGSIWRGRFQAAPLEAEHHLLNATLTLEQAPVRARLALAATAWPWSSARHHAGSVGSPLITEHETWWKTGNTPFEREARHDAALQQPVESMRVAELLRALSGGWPLGSSAFIASASSHASRPLAPRPRGRPPARVNMKV